MAVRHVFSFAFGISLSTSALLFAPAAVRAADEVEQAPEVANAKFQFLGEITTNSIPVRSGPSNNFYATMKLNKGERVKVVGIKYDWLKIVPPDGSFSFVPQAYVTRRGDGKIGRVNSTANVRAGSSENGMKTTIQVKLDENTDVEILDAHEEYYKIKPPEGAYLFVNKQYVKPLERLGDDQPTNEIAKAEPAQPKADEPAAPPAEGEPAVPGTPAEGGVAVSSDPTQPDTKPAAAPAQGAVAEGPASQPAPPVVTSAIEDFRKVEADFAAADKQPVESQPIEQLAERYTALSKAGLTGNTKRIVDARLKALQMRADARDQLLAFRKSQDNVKQRQQTLVVENQELTERMKQTQVSLFTAVGTLRVSSLQRGSTTLYRLTDPATGRTVVYIRSNDPSYAGMLNQFVGVKGELMNDERLKMKIINPTEATPVDPSKVNGTVIATITPPSMVPQSTATVDQAEAN